MIPDPIHILVPFADMSTRDYSTIMRVRFTILALLMLLLGASCQRQKAEPAASQPRVAPAVSRAPGKAPVVSRPVYAHSVVAGGVENSAEMAEAMGKDPVVKAHYAGLQPAAFRPERLANDQQGYVSYRVRDKVYWSRRLMTLKKGETVLSDGTSLLRARCGNRIALTPQEPTLAEANEPPETVLNSWQDSAVLAGIPPVPEASLVAGTLLLPGVPEKAQVSSLLTLPGTDQWAIAPMSNVGGSGSLFLLGGGGGGGGGGGFGGGVSGGGGSGGGFVPSPPQPPIGTGGLPNTGIVIPPNGVPPILISVVPPGTTPNQPPNWVTLPPITSIVNPPLPPGTPPPNWLPPGGGSPPLISQPPGFPPISIPPGTPPGTPPPTVPPGTGNPPTVNPPRASDPPPDFPPPGPPPGSPPVDNPIPEPSTLLLAVSALAAFGAHRYLGKKR